MKAEMVKCSECGELKRKFCKSLCSACYKRGWKIDNPDWRANAMPRNDRKPRVGAVRLLCPGDWLETPDGTARIGFVWEIDGDRVEVRSYECPETRGPTIRHMTRAQACWYQIVPNDRYGVERPLLGVAR